MREPSRVHQSLLESRGGALVQQPTGAADQGDSSPHRCRRHLPNRDGVIWLVGTVLCEQNDEGAVSRRSMSAEVDRAPLAILRPPS